MSSRLRLLIEPDTDGTAELFAEVSHASFAGASSAWFNLEQLRGFGQQLQEVFPIPQGSSLRLEGGYWSNSSPAALDQVHVGLAFYPIGGTGLIGVRVNLATALQSDERPESQFAVAVELRTHYEQLRAFGQSIVHLADGQASSATLEANDG